MRCPHAPEIDVGARCTRHRCWMHDVRADGACAAHDTGSTHLVVADVARIQGVKPSIAAERIARGREKMAKWLSLLTTLENIEETATKVQIPTGLYRKFPILPLLKMNPARWAALLTAYRAGHLGTKISLDSQQIVEPQPRLSSNPKPEKRNEHRRTQTSI